MNFTPPLQGILFDFDGLILDTETPIYQAWQEMFRKYDQELLLEDWAKILGKSGYDGGPTEEFLQNIEDDMERVQILKQVSSREHELLGQQTPLPGAVELIQRAKHQGLQLGIVSSSDRNWIHTHLERLGLKEYFDHTSCADEVEEAKPDPALYNLGINKMGLNPDKLLALEDSPHGVLAAKRAGLYCIAVPNTLTRQLPFYSNGGLPDLVLESLQDFPWDDFVKGEL
jgi:HAD superfamily hydrolase (TIGR01509 family)